MACPALPCLNFIARLVLPCRERSLVNENSDTWVVKQLGEELMPEFRRLRREEQLGWTQIMNRQMRKLWEKGVSEEATSSIQ